MKISPYMHLNRIEFALTHHCSGSCIHCSLGDKLHSLEKCHHVQTEQAVKAIQWLSQNFQITSVMTFGGEPLLYPDVVCAIHQAARSCGIARRQLITNGYFSKNEERIREVAAALGRAGVNELLLSVDTFHREKIPAEPVYCFAKAVRELGLSAIRLQPAWVVNREFENHYNRETAEILSEFSDLDIPVASGNNIFMAGNAAKYLSEFYPPPSLNLSDCCGSMPYTGTLDDITSLSIEPNGDVTSCAFVIGNLYKESMEEIVCRYNPYEHENMRAVLTGGVSGLLEFAKAKGIEVDCAACYSICDLCRQITKKATC